MTESPGWWRRRSNPAKAITVLATLCVLEIGLCSALPYNSNLWGFLIPLSFLTGVVLVIAFLIWLFTSPHSEEFHD
jgi:hypothetical protein